MFGDQKIEINSRANSQSSEFLNSESRSLQRRRFPRLFLASKEDQLQPLTGVLLALPDRTYLPVLGLSSAGIMISPTGILGKIRLGQILDCRLRFAQPPIRKTNFVTEMGASFGSVHIQEPILLRLKVMRLTSLVACLVLDSANFEDRLKVEQGLKDHFIFSNIKAMDVSNLPFQFREAQWWGAPFDTNFLAWSQPKDQSGSTLPQWIKLIYEYDGVVLTMTDLDLSKAKRPVISLKRSLPNVDEARGYCLPWLESEAQKISIGASWKARLCRLLESSSEHPALSNLARILAQS